MIESWFLFALAAVLIWSIGAILGKFIRVNYIKSPIGYLMIAIPAALFGFFFLLFGEFSFPNLEMNIYIFSATASAILGYYLYLVSIHEEDISRIITLIGLQPLITLILSTIILREILTPKDYLAFPLIIAGSMLMAVRRIEKKLRISRGIWFLFGSIFCFSISSIFLKLAAEVNFVSVMVIREFWFFTIPVLIFLSSKEVRKRTKQDLKQLNKRKLLLVYITEIVGMIGVAFFFLAIQRGPVSLVSLVEGTEGLFVIVLAALISKFIPRILKEEITKKTITFKVVSALLMIAGLYLIVI